MFLNISQFTYKVYTYKSRWILTLNTFAANCFFKKRIYSAATSWNLMNIQEGKWLVSLSSFGLLIFQKSCMSLKIQQLILQLLQRFQNRNIFVISLWKLKLEQENIQDAPLPLNPAAQNSYRLTKSYSYPLAQTIAYCVWMDFTEFYVFVTETEKVARGIKPTHTC